MKITKAQQIAAQKALNTFGMEKCVEAYKLNVEQGEGGTVIELNTGIPQRNQGAAIRAGEGLLKAELDRSREIYRGELEATDADGVETMLHQG